jgi:hypothetical protein
MLQQFRIGGVPERGQAQQHGVVAEAACEVRFRQGLVGRSADPGDQGEGPVSVREPSDLFRSAPQDRFEEGVGGVPNLELGRVNSDGETSGPGIHVVADEGSLVTRGPSPVRIEGEGQGGNDLARAKVPQELGTGGMGHGGNSIDSSIFPERRLAGKVLLDGRR